jgi:3-deoxy-7-phosphoheptulonate synthase
MIEVHPHPGEALSDGYQSLTVKNFKILLEKIEKIATVVNKKIENATLQVTH